MISKQSVKKNYMYQLLYQSLVLLIPFIISPYLTRVLGDTMIGIHTFVSSVASYFIIAANLGIAKYGQRIISETRNDRILLGKTFWSLNYAHLLLSASCLVIYLIIIILFPIENKAVFLIEALYVASAVFDITWFYYGVEFFKNVVIKNALVKTAECILIFLFVKKNSDLLKYAFITSSALLVGNLSLIPAVIRFVPPTSVSKCEVFAHMKPLFLLSISVIAVSLYTVFDKILLGIMSTKENVAYYEYANRVVSLPRTFITIITTVLFPRFCRMVKDRDLKGQLFYLSISTKMVSFIGFASLFGLLAIARQFAVVYYGNSFAMCGPIMMMMSPLPLIIGFGEILRTQLLIPNHLDKIYTFSTLINAVINIILSFVFIPIIGVFGAVLGTCVAELFGCCFQLFACRKMVNFRFLLGEMIPFFLSGMIMFVVVMLIKPHCESGILLLSIKVIAGVFVYCLSSLAYYFFFRKENLFKIIKK